MRRIDANIVLRYLLDDNAELCARAAAIIDQQETFVSFFQRWGSVARGKIESGGVCSAGFSP